MKLVLASKNAHKLVELQNEGAFIAPENVTAVTLSAQLIIRQLFLSSLKMMWKLKEQILLLWKRERLYLHLRLTLQ